MGLLNEINRAENTIVAATQLREVTDYAPVRASIALLLGRDTAYEERRKALIDTGLFERDFMEDTVFFLPSLYAAERNPELVLALRAVQVEEARKASATMQTNLSESSLAWQFFGAADPRDNQYLNAHHDLSAADHAAISAKPMFAKILKRFPDLTAERLKAVLKPAPVLLIAPQTLKFQPV